MSACDKNSVVMKQLQESLADCCSQMLQMRRYVDGLRQQVCSAAVPVVQAGPPSYAAPQSFGMGRMSRGRRYSRAPRIRCSLWALGLGALCGVSGPSAAAWPYGLVLLPGSSDLIQALVNVDQSRGAGTQDQGRLPVKIWPANRLL